MSIDNSNSYSFDDSLIHYGVKGMRWGVRRARRSSRERKIRNRAQNDLERHNLELTTKRPAFTMTDEELKTSISRLQLEQQYNSLVNSRSTIKKGERFMSSNAGNISRQVAANVVTPELTRMGKEAIKNTRKRG